MSDDPRRPIVIRRSRRTLPGHGGGAWKIAYADFVTAMMAFFLLMWLLGSTTKGELEGIAEFFRNPLRVSNTGGSGSGDSSSVIRGGGRDLTRRDNQVRKGGGDEHKRSFDPESARAELERIELARMQDLKARLERMFESDPRLKTFRRQLLIDITNEGLRIQIVDAHNRPMFALGSAEPHDHARLILREIAGPLNELPNRIVLSGHTDATPYAGGERGYSNWELSADRANASRRELVAAGLAEGKVARVIGLGSTILFDPSDRFSELNRRISIVVLNRRAEEALKPAPFDAQGGGAQVGQVAADNHTGRRL